MMTQARDYVRASANPAVIRRVAELLRLEWDPANEFAAPDGSQSAESHAQTILAMLSTGGDTALVTGYLRRAEADCPREPRTDSRTRMDLATRIWQLLLDAATDHHSGGQLAT